MYIQNIVHTTHGYMQHTTLHIHTLHLIHKTHCYTIYHTYACTHARNTVIHYNYGIHTTDATICDPLSKKPKFIRKNYAYYKKKTTYAFIEPVLKEIKFKSISISFTRSWRV